MLGLDADLAANEVDRDRRRGRRRVAPHVAQLPGRRRERLDAGDGLGFELDRRGEQLEGEHDDVLDLIAVVLLEGVSAGELPPLLAFGAIELGELGAHERHALGVEGLLAGIDASFADTTGLAELSLADADRRTAVLRVVEAVGLPRRIGQVLRYGALARLVEEEFHQHRADEVRIVVGGRRGHHILLHIHYCTSPLKKLPREQQFRFPL